MQQDFAKQGRLAGAGRRHEVDDLHARIVEVAAIGLGRAVVLAKDVLEDLDTEPAGLVTAVIPDATMIVLVALLVVMIVV